MSVLSLKTAVTCEKPLRESERVLSRPGMPASAVSIGNVTCFSISTGDSAGAKVLTCTCLLVMSGTASIGSRSATRRPRSPREREQQHEPAVADRKCEDALIIALAQSSAERLHELGLEREGVGDRDGLAGLEAGDAPR